MAAIAILLFSGGVRAEPGLPPHPKAAPLLSQPDLIQWTVGLVLVILLILVSAWMLRRLNPLSLAHGNRLRVLAGISLGPRERVVLLQVGQKQLLLGVAPGRVETLHVLEPDETLQPGGKPPVEAAPATFAERIRQAVRGSR